MGIRETVVQGAVEIKGLQTMSFERKITELFDADSPVAIVCSTDCSTGYPVGFGVARALFDKGVKVIAVDSDRRSVARYSTKVAFLHKPEVKTPDQLMDFLKIFGKMFREKPVLFLLNDEDVLALSRHYDELSAVMRLTTGRDDIRYIDKTEQYREFIDKGVPIPTTVIVTARDDAVRISGPVGYPCIVKPPTQAAIKSRIGKKVLFCRDRSGLQDAVEKIRRVCDTFIVQEYIPGGNDRLYTFGSYVSRDRSGIISFTGRKIRQFPPDFGSCRCGESVESSEVERSGKMALDALRYSGISQVEFKLDPRDGILKVMEVNGRAWLWISLAVACGANIPFAAYCDAIGKEIPEFRQSRKRVIWINLIEDLLNSVYGYGRCGYRESSLTFGQWLKSIQGEKEFAFFSWDDPIPAFVRTVQFLGSYPRTLKQCRKAQ